MIDENEKLNRRVLLNLLHKEGVIRSENSDLHITTLCGDGSSRNFWRVKQGGESLCLAVAPSELTESDLREARAARDIGLHLLQQGVRVPRQYGWEEAFGLLLFEDMGDCKLHDLVLKVADTGKGVDPNSIHDLYRQAVGRLAYMQIRGREGFHRDWCWDTEYYDKKVMLERESGYFLKAFWQDLLKRESPDGLQEEFELLADRAAAISSDYFLHRDFQCRNIMVKENDVCFIDYQGARLGPLAYDLASLLRDPYAALSSAFQEEMVDVYLNTLEKLISVNRKKFGEEYLLLALQRNLQIVGAFSFLSNRRNKVFFRQYIHPALLSLHSVIMNPLFDDLRVLRKTVSSTITTCK